LANFFWLPTLAFGEQKKDAKTEEKKDAKSADDLKKLQGDWNVVKLERCSVDQERRTKPERRPTFRFENERLFIGGAEEPLGRVKLNADVQPKKIDLGDLTIGIYELNGDVLKICWDDVGRARPTEFETLRPDDPSRTLFILERKKPKKK
jgi:uncharacterized protein (TIGR03067 family)